MTCQCTMEADMADGYWPVTPHGRQTCDLNFSRVFLQKTRRRTSANRPIAETRKKKKTAPKRREMAKEWLIFSIAMVVFISAVYSIDDKCSACTAIAEELERGLMNERPRNHLDMRHRLDSKGQREGKVIDYRVSELRVVELLDGLCEKMQDYTLEKVDSGTRVWIKVNNWDILKTNKQEAKAYSKDISSFCGRLLEETEDELSELIKKGSIKAGDVNKVLCEDLSKYCQRTSAGYDDGKDIDGEL